MPDPLETETEAIATLAKEAAGKILTGPDDRKFLLTPENVAWDEITDPHDLLPAPKRIRQRVELQTVDSLVDYVNMFKAGEPLMFADIARSLITAPLDYHEPDKPQNVEHIATLQLLLSEEWKTWTAISSRLMPQLDFARFVEENAADIAAPSGADLLEVVRDLQATRKVDFTKVVRTASDNENFEFTDTTETKSTRGGVEVPSRFTLSIPVYFGEASIRLDAFLRWRLQDTTLTLGIQLHRAEHVRQSVFREIVAAAAARVSGDAVFGHLV